MQCAWLLVNPEDRVNIIGMITDVQGAAAALGLQVEVLYASTSNELETALAGVVQKQAGALMIVPGGLFLDRSVQIATLALRDGVPAIYANRAFRSWRADRRMTTGSITKQRTDALLAAAQERAWPAVRRRALRPETRWSAVGQDDGRQFAQMLRPNTSTQGARLLPRPAPAAGPQSELTPYNLQRT